MILLLACEAQQQHHWENWKPLKLYPV